MTELMPCPFCGKTPSIKYYSMGFEDEPYRIDCCYITITKSSEKRAAKKWNTRAPSKDREFLIELSKIEIFVPHQLKILVDMCNRIGQHLEENP